jgi:hypothetical protein
MPSGRKTRFVPRIVFASTVAGVAPSCGVLGRHNQDIVLAIAGFTGCPQSDAGADAAAGGSGGGGSPCSTGGAQISNGGRASSGGAKGTGSGIIVLAIMGFSGGGSE